MKRHGIIVPIVLLFFAGCTDQLKEEERLLEEAEARYEVMAERAEEARERASEEARRRAEEARREAEMVWERAEEARRALDREHREQLREAWEAAREAREEAQETWEEAFHEEHDGWEAFGAAMEALGEKMEQLGEELEASFEGKYGEGVEPVDWRKLADLFPRSVLGLRRVDVEGERAGALGIHVAQATATYERGEACLEITLVDLGTLRGVAMAGIDWLDLEIDREDRHGIERTFTYRGYPVHLKLEKSRDDLRVEAEVVVADRFVVSYKGSGLELDRDEFDELLEVIDYDDLEEMRHQRGEG